MYLVQSAALRLSALAKTLLMRAIRVSPPRPRATPARARARRFQQRRNWRRRWQKLVREPVAHDLNDQQLRERLGLRPRHERAAICEAPIATSVMTGRL